MDTELLQIALAGFRQALGSSTEIVAAWTAADASVGRCMLTVSKLELKARLVSALETVI